MLGRPVPPATSGADRSTSPSTGTPPPTKPVLPPCGATATPQLEAPRHHGSGLLGGAWADDGRGGTAVPTGPVDAVPRGHARLGDDVPASDHLSKLRQEVTSGGATVR